VDIPVSASKEGKLRVVYGGWDDANAGADGVEARIIPRRQGKR
jgi:hypothetical protein